MDAKYKRYLIWTTSFLMPVCLCCLTSELEKILQKMAVINP